MNRYLFLLQKSIVLFCLLFTCSFARADMQSLQKDDDPSALVASDSLQNRVYDDEEILKWARKVIVMPCSFNYENYDDVHKLAKGYFLPATWVSVQKQLIRYGDRSRFIKRKNLLQCTMTGKLQLLRKGTMKGVYAWHVAVPMHIVSLHHSACSVVTSMLITRYPFKHSSDGLAVKRYYMTINAVN